MDGVEDALIDDQDRKDESCIMVTLIIVIGQYLLMPCRSSRIISFMPIFSQFEVAVFVITQTYLYFKFGPYIYQKPYKHIIYG